MADAVPGKPPTVVQLVWEHDLVFGATSGGTRMTLDSAASAGPSPMQALGFALTGCMAMDIVHILQKGRHDLRGLTADLTATRAPENPHRFTGYALHFTITGTVPDAQVQRAIDLSHDKYCSVWHSLRQDVAFTTTFTVTPPA